ncbi:MAG: UGSC family (seleno)protein [Dehalococcoidia bacterium]
MRTADVMARRNGYPSYRYAVMPSPIGNLKPDQIKQRAIEVLPQVLSILGLDGRDA